VNSSEAILFDRACALPDIPLPIDEIAVIMTEGSNGKTILACGATCYSLQKEGWRKHGGFTQTLYGNLGAKAVTMSTGVFVFGDTGRSQFMKKGSEQWESGPSLHPKGLSHSSCVAKISQDELLIMGGLPFDQDGNPVQLNNFNWTDQDKRVYKYNVRDKSWTKIHDMKTARKNHACAMFHDGPSSYILVAGGRTGANTYTNSTEMYFLNGTVVEGTPMNEARGDFTMAFIESSEPRVYAIGGVTSRWPRLKSIEFWDSSLTWKYTNMEMMSKRGDYGSVTVPKSMLRDYC